jgi:hypothetical protein
MEDVHDHLQVIEHDPLACRKTVNRRRANLVLLPEPRFNFPGDCFEVRFGSSGTDNEEIGEGGNVAEIEDEDPFGFLVRRKLRAGDR